jgi:choloylglycine hydrolase
MKRIGLLPSLALCAFFVVSPAHPCTTFILQGKERILFGRNLDWESEDALVIVNPRGVQKTAFVPAGITAAKWSSKHGSVTFNSASWELPTGGMNEAGLVVENMWLFETQCPAVDARPAVNALQWIQYQLDNCRTVAEVLDTDRSIRVDLTGLPVTVHYLVCDASGDCATIEFLKGAMVCHRGKELPYRALANDIYQTCVAYAKANPEPEGTTKVKPDSVIRFAHAAARAANFKSGTPREDLDYAYDTLDQVCQGDFTVWRMVYDVTSRQIHYRTRSHPQERVLALKQIDFACGRAVRFFNLRRETGDGTPEFQDLTEAKHRQYVQTYLTQPWVKQQFGDMTPFVEAMLVHLRGYSPAGGASEHKASLVPEASGAMRISADELLRKALAARGGKDAALRVQSYHAKGTLQVAGLEGSPMEMFAKRPGKLLLFADLKATRQTKAGRFQMGTDGQVAWEAQPGARPAALKGKHADERRQGALFFADYDDPDDCQAATCLGETEFDGCRCYVLQLSKRSGERTVHYYDAATFLLAGSVGSATIRDVPSWEKASYTEYRPFGDFHFATRARYRTQQSDAVVKVTSIELNGVEDSVFDLPREVRAVAPN